MWDTLPGLFHTERGKHPATPSQKSEPTAFEEIVALVTIPLEARTIHASRAFPN